MKNGFIETDRSKRKSDIFFLNQRKIRQCCFQIFRQLKLYEAIDESKGIVCLNTNRQLIQCEGKIKVLSYFPILNQNKSKC